MKKYFLSFYYIVFFIFCISSIVIAQDTLPGFSVRNISKGKNQVSWTNPYETCIQLAVQRSFDSIRFFQTIYSALSPSLPQNGFVDNNAATGGRTFYRIFYVIGGGNYYFTKSKPANNGFVTSGEENQEMTIKKRINTDALNPLPYYPSEKKFVKIYNHNKDSLLFVMEYPEYKNFKDSISVKTKDSLLAISNNEVLLKRYIPKYIWKPSIYVFINNNGYVTLSLPLVKLHSYRLIFRDESGSEIFQIKRVKEDQLIFDKTNFLHAGRFYFELYEDDKLKEKSSLYLESDF